MSNGSKSVWSYILIPGGITLAVTLIRLWGELRQWNESFFKRSAGGGGAVVGIVWLAFVFAVYFAVKLQNEGEKPSSKGKSIGLAFLALTLWVAGEAVMFRTQDSKSAILLAAGLVLILVALAVMRLSWPPYFNILLGYALLARIPVVVIMYLAMQGGWNTHYDAAPPAMANADLTTRFIQLALIPQFTFWIAFSVIFCGLIGLIVVAIRKPAVTA